MKLNFDNLEDARAKLSNTFCYYKGRAILVKGVDYDGAQKKYFMITTTLNGNHRESVYCDDEDFNCSEFNVGYVNWGHMVVWYYRAPARQYRQGLKADQVRAVCADPNFHRNDVQFAACRNVAQMMENVYYRAEEVRDLLKAGEHTAVAFHKNFAAKYDRIHDDLILEHKGKLIGHTKDFKEFKLMEEYVHLTEALMEAVA